MPSEPLRIHHADSPPSTAAPAGLSPDLAGDRLIGRAEFQALLGISQSCFERWLAMGRIPQPTVKFSKTCHKWSWIFAQKWLVDGCPDPRSSRKGHK